MSFEANVRKIPGLLAGADFSSTGKFRFGVIAAGLTVILPTGSGQRVNGVIYDNPTSGHRVEFAIGDVVMVEAGAAVADAALVQSDSVGRVITQASTGIVVGTALAAAAVAGDVIPVLFQLQGAP